MGHDMVARAPSIPKNSCSTINAVLPVQLVIRMKSRYAATTRSISIIAAGESPCSAISPRRK